MTQRLLIAMCSLVMLAPALGCSGAGGYEVGTRGAVAWATRFPIFEPSDTPSVLTHAKQQARRRGARNLRKPMFSLVYSGLRNS